MVLLVESNAEMRRAVARSLEQLDVQVLEADRPQHARAHLIRETPEVLMLALDHGGREGGLVIEANRESCRTGEPPAGGRVVVTTAERPEDEWRRRYRPDLLVYQPFDVRYVCHRILLLEG
jgi:DNA-binding response OmpR family regulator